MNQTLILLMASTLTLAAPAPEEPPSPPPIATWARMVGGKVQIEVTATVLTTVLEPRTETVLVNGRTVIRTYKVQVPVERVQKQTITAGDDLRVFDTTGTAVTREKLAELLQEQRDVLLSADGKPVNSSHLRNAKPGTLVLVLPSYKAPGAPPDNRATPERPRSSGLQKR